MRIVAGFLLSIAVCLPSVAHAETQSETLTARVDAAIAGAAAGKDAEALRSWISASFAQETYDGAMKGARGAFLTGSGNGTDQALLLSQMIKHAAPDTSFRFAACAPQTFAFVPGPLAAAPFDIDELAGAVEDADVQAAVRELAALRREAGEVARDQSRWIADALASAALPTPPRDVSVRHVWLQAQDGQTWRDLDTTTADGAAPCSAVETFDTLPEAFFHTVEIALVVERRTDAGVVATPAVKRSLRIADIAAAEIVAGFGEPMGLVERRIDAETQRIVYTPVLRVDGDTTTGEPVMLPFVPEGIGKAIARSLGGAIAALGGDAEEDDQDQSVTGVWLAFDMKGPASQRSLTAVIVDRVGFAARQSGQVATAELQPFVYVPGDYAAFAAFWQIGVLTGIQQADLPAAEIDLDTLDGVSRGLDELLRLFPAIRRDFGIAAAGDATLLVAGLEPVGTEGSAFTLTLNALHVPGGGTDVEAAAADAAALLAAETMLAALAGGELHAAADSRSVLEAARRAGTALAVFRPGDDARVAGASRDALARLQARLDAGYAVLAPATAPRVGDEAVIAWLTVDPGTGLVRDEHQSGRHAAAVEYQINTSRSISTWERFRRFSCAVMRPVVVAGALVYGATGGAAGGDLLKVVAKTAQAAAENRKKTEAAAKIACSGGSGAPP